MTRRESRLMANQLDYDQFCQMLEAGVINDTGLALSVIRSVEFPYAAKLEDARFGRIHIVRIQRDLTNVVLSHLLKQPVVL